MKETIKNYIANELRALRAKKNKSIVELADDLGLTKDTISRYENAKTSINIDVLEKILDYYDLDFDIFFKNVCANKQNKDQKQLKE